MWDPVWRQDLSLTEAGTSSTPQTINAHQGEVACLALNSQVRPARPTLSRPLVWTETHQVILYGQFFFAKRWTSLNILGGIVHFLLLHPVIKWILSNRKFDWHRAGHAGSHGFGQRHTRPRLGHLQAQSARRIATRIRPRHPLLVPQLPFNLIF